ncbi:iron transporter FeoA [Achromatium sp. WMS2]|nr:iron transporter FeoA [Achromatium sp. WMS2]
MTLKELQIGDLASITGFATGTRSYRHRLLTMGLTPGTQIKVTRFAPLGDPMEIEVRGYSLSLRRDEAAALHVKLVDAITA